MISSEPACSYAEPAETHKRLLFFIVDSRACVCAHKGIERVAKGAVKKSLGNGEGGISLTFAKRIKTEAKKNR